MPTYDYVCHHCGHRLEVIHGVYGDGPATCPVCDEGPVRKGFSTPSIHFKGSGWAKKDRSSARAAARAKDDSGSEAATSAEKSDGGGTPDRGGSDEKAATGADSGDKPSTTDKPVRPGEKSPSSERTAASDKSTGSVSSAGKPNVSKSSDRPQAGR